MVEAAPGEIAETVCELGAAVALLPEWVVRP
jgi:hypothetical protein